MSGFGDMFCTFARRCRQAPRAVGQADERFGADQLQAGLTHITGVVEVRLSRGVDLCTLHHGRSPTGLG